MPRSPPPPATAVQIPIACARASVGNDDVMTESVTGMIIAAPTPATTRVQIRNAEDSAKPGPDGEQQRCQHDDVRVDDPQHHRLRGVQILRHLLLRDVQSGRMQRR